MQEFFDRSPLIMWKNLSFSVLSALGAAVPHPNQYFSIGDVLMGTSAHNLL